MNSPTMGPADKTNQRIKNKPAPVMAQPRPRAEALKDLTHSVMGMVVLEGCGC